MGNQVLAIVGGGVSATAIAYLLREYSDYSIQIFDGKLLSDHAAYGNLHENLLCNTSAEVMSISPENPYHFSDYLGLSHEDASKVFPTRKEYGEYLQRFLSLSNVEHIKIDIESAIDNGREVTLHAANEETFRAHKVIITGVPMRENIPPQSDKYREMPYFFSTPYSQNFTDFLQNKDSLKVGILGTSLSGIDAMRTVLRANSQAVAISPSGVLPCARERLSAEVPSWMSFSRFREASYDLSTFQSYLQSLFSQFSEKTPNSSFCRDPEKILAENIANADVAHWQDAIGPLIDWANIYWTSLPGTQGMDLRKILSRANRRYISSLPIQVAQELDAAFSEGSLDVFRGNGTGHHSQGKYELISLDKTVPALDAVVSCSGYKMGSWVQTSGLGVTISPYKNSDSEGKRDSLSEGYGSQKLGKNIFFAGLACSSNTPVSNYSRTAILQAQAIVNFLISHE